MKAYKEKTNKYYKYSYGYNTEFVQPAISSNGTMGGDTFAVSWSTNGGDARGTAYLSCYPQNSDYLYCYSRGGRPYIAFYAYNPDPIICTGYRVGYDGWNGSNLGYFYGSNDGSNWTELWSSTTHYGGGGSFHTITFENSTPYTYYQLVSYCTGGYGGDGHAMSRFQLLGKVYGAVPEEVPEGEPYDFIIEGGKDYLLKITQREYYKYAYEDYFITSLPVYSSAAQAEAGKDGVSFTPSTMYPVVGQSSSVTVTNSYDYKVVFTFENGFVLKNWSFSGWVIPNAMPSASLSAIEGSNDQQNWTSISNDGSNTIKYTYYRVTFVGSEVGRYGSMGMSYFNMSGIITKQISVKADTSDYDYYVDVDHYKAIKSYSKGEITKKYWKYVEKPWTQPVITSAGTMGGSSFAATQSSSYNGNDFWYVFSSSGSWHSAAGLPQWVAWYNPEPLIVKGLSFVANGSGNIGKFEVQGSNDYENWAHIKSVNNTESTGAFSVDMSSNTKAFKYWRLYITSCYYYYSGTPYPLITNGFTITANYLDTVPGTEQDHDF